MSEFGLQDAFLVERVQDPNSREFAELMSRLLAPRSDDRSRARRFGDKGVWRYELPYRGDPEFEISISELTPFRLRERAMYRNGLPSLAFSAAALVDLIALASAPRLTTTVVFSNECDNLASIMASSGNAAPHVHYDRGYQIANAGILHRPQTIVVDHTTLCLPIDKLLNLCYKAGVEIVDGVVPYHVAAVRGWDVVAGTAKWSFTADGSHVTIGPDDDSSRMIRYRRSDYMKFIEPSRWEGKARQYMYEIRSFHHGLITYRAVYVGSDCVNEGTGNVQSFKLPMCSSDDMVLVAVNKRLAAGTFASKSNNAYELAKTERDYAIEVRRDLFVSCVEYLISKDKGADLTGEAIRYVTHHNYVDLVDGVRIVRCASLSYPDALCVAMVCSLTAFSLRYRLTNESIPDIERTRRAAGLKDNAPLGALGRLAWLFGTYVSDSLGALAVRSRDKALRTLYSTDLIPGVCYEVYMDSHYESGLPWQDGLGVEVQERAPLEKWDDDPFTKFLGGKEAAYAPTVLKEKPASSLPKEVPPYVPNRVADPEVAMQQVYDNAFPGNSVAQVQAAAEWRRVKDVDVRTEFFGRIEINKDVAAPERLPEAMPVRTTALPASRTTLLDAILASAKRNFNPPDLQMQSDPWAYARYLATKFEDWAFLPNFRSTIMATYCKDPITFNVTDYLDWRAKKDGKYRSALEAECPEELVCLNLEKYDTIVKQRVKPKLSVSAQHELQQPQVIVSNTKTDTAMFTHVMREVFNRFDNALRPELCSAGRLSDDEISEWLTRNMAAVTSLPAVELDSGKYDKSQGLLARMIEVYIMQDLGLDPNVTDIFQDSYVGRVSSKSLGLMFIISNQMRSGGPDTMLGNLIYNFVSASESIGMENIQLMLAKGDDNVSWLRPGYKLNAQQAVFKMSGLFNLETKLVAGEVIYFSSGYVVPLEDVVYFVPDPIKVLELMGERAPNPLTLKERYVSFRDRVKSMLVDARVPYALQALVRHRLRVPELNVVMLVDALAAVAADVGVFARVKGESL